MSEHRPVQPAPENVRDTPVQAGSVSGYLSAGPGLGLVFALLGGAAAWGILQSSYPAFRMPRNVQDMAGPAMTSDQDRMIATALNKANRQNTMFALAVVGAIVGGAMGIGEGVARRSFKTVLIGAVSVALIGLIAGVAGGVLGDLTYQNAKPDSEPISLGGTILIQSIALGVLGAGIGLGLGTLTGSGRTIGKCVFAGLLAGIGSGLLYPIILSFALPGAQTQVLVPLTGSSRLLWIAVAAVLIGLIIPGITGKNSAHNLGVR